MIPRALAAGAFRAQEALLGRPTFRVLRRLADHAGASVAERREDQRQALNAFLREVLAHSPWHAGRLRAAGLDGAIGRGTLALADFQRLPTMDRADARLHGEAMRWREVPGGTTPYATGGSSGEPLRFHLGRTRQAADAACRLHARRAFGVLPGMREAFLWGAPRELANTDRVKRLRDALVNHRLWNAFRMTPDGMDRWLDELRHWQPAVLYGYASSLARFARHLRARDTTGAMPGLRLVCTTGEPLPNEDRALLAATFRVPVANEYGCRDGGLLACDTPLQALRVFTSCVLVELLAADGTPVAPGETGEVVLTNFHSQAQPFVRYRTGDHARRPLTDDPLAPIESLAEVIGRNTDFLVASDGTVMHALAALYELREIPGLAAFQCEQFSRQVLELRLIAGPGFAPASLVGLTAALKARLGQDVDIRLRLLESLPVAASGKHRVVVSHVSAA